MVICDGNCDDDGEDDEIHVDDEDNDVIIVFRQTWRNFRFE